MSNIKIFMNRVNSTILFITLLILSTFNVNLSYSLNLNNSGFENQMNNNEKNKTDKVINRPLVIFIHGLGAPAEIYELTKEIKKLFNQNGYDLYISKYPAVTTIEDGAEIVYQEIKELTDKYEKFHLVAHSMGGLVSRMMLHRYKNVDPNFVEKCLSLTSLAVPHKGSPIARYAYDLYNRLNPKKNQSLQNKVLKKLSLEKSKEIFEKLLDLLNITGDLLYSLTPVAMKEFNQEVLDIKWIKYYSIAFYIPNPIRKHTHIPYFRLTSKLNESAGFKMNDGIVPTSSSLWGEVIKIMPGDHYSETLPIPFDKKFIYKDVFQEVINNLNQKF